MGITLNYLANFGDDAHIITPSRQKSYYGKCAYIVDHIDNSDVYTLYSYTTCIITIIMDNDDDDRITIKKWWDGYSVTTMNHINDFIKTVAQIHNTTRLDNCGGKKWWTSLGSMTDIA